VSTSATRRNKHVQKPAEEPKEQPREKLEERKVDLSGARVVVTGANGFFGRYVMAALGEAGAATIPISRRSGYDLRNEGEALQAVLEMQPDILVHLAGLVGGIGAILGRPATFLRDNLLMGMNVAHAAAVGRVKLVAMGSIASYPEAQEVEAMPEEQLWNGFPEPAAAPLGIAKRTLLALMQAYRQEYRLRFAYLIPSNLYGPGDPFRGIVSGVIPSLINMFMEAKSKKIPQVTLWGTGKAVRSFLFAADAARAVAIAAAQLDQDEPVNLPGPEERTVGETASLIAKLVGYEGTILWNESKPEGRKYGVLDGTQARDLLDWEPETKLAEGLKETVAWHLANGNER